MSEFYPAYISLIESGELVRRAEKARSMLKHCNLCTWECGVDRTTNELGQCHTGMLAHVSSFMPHHGEERPISGGRGSGTIFFSRCNLHCVYCQNYDISQTDRGKDLAMNRSLSMLALVVRSSRWMDPSVAMSS
jgi:putative pyruvate formate lyase activating enzyme